MRLLVHSFLLLAGIAQCGAVYDSNFQQPYGTVEMVTAASRSCAGAASCGDDSRASHTASVSIDGTVSPQVRVKYLSMASLTQKYDSTWAGQAFSDVFSSHGGPVGTVDAKTVNCDPTNESVCDVKVPAPDTAPVFLSDQTLAELHNTGTIDPSTLAISNRNQGIADAVASTSQGGDVNGTLGFSRALPVVGALVAVFTFVSLESLLSYAITGNSPFGLVLDTTKNAL